MTTVAGLLLLPLTSFYSATYIFLYFYLFLIVLYKDDIQFEEREKQI